MTLMSLSFIATTQTSPSKVSEQHATRGEGGEVRYVFTMTKEIGGNAMDEKKKETINGRPLSFALPSTTQPSS